MAVCSQCGVPATGPFCTNCGAHLGAANELSADPSTSPATQGEPTPGFAVPNLRGAGLEQVPEAMMVVESTPVLLPGPFRTTVVWETRFVMLAFLAPGVASAIIVLSQHVAGVQNFTVFPTLVHHEPVTNLILLILAYLPVASIVPLALLLLARTGQTPKVLGMGFPSITRDIIPGLGIAALAFISEFILIIPFAQLLVEHPGLVTKVSEGAVPKYYIIYGLILSATTAIAEEVMVNGYLLTRLHQLGWSDKKSLALSLTLRTSYHIYYGFGFLLTVPFGYFNTRSFQKHHKLNRPIVAHFLFDAILITISILHR
jgi:membrane protease YdiL (CAAX protease family)